MHCSYALAEMGADLPAVARAAGMTAQRLQRELASDPDLKYDKHNKRVLFTCFGLLRDQPAVPSPRSKVAAHAPRRGLRTTAAAGGSDPTPPSLATAFSLHSRPTAKRKILLDFNGHTITNTAWNSLKNLPTITIPPYDIDGVAASFSATELSNIIRCVGGWRAA